MSTTRHLVNRQRRLAAARTATAPVREARARPTAVVRTAVRPREESRERPKRVPRRRAWTLPAVLALLTVLFGGFAGWAAHHAATLRNDPATANTALTDNATTSEVKGTIAQEINSVFSYDYADPARTDDAARTALTGKAIAQYADLLAGVRKQAPALKLVLTTTVSDSGVEMLVGDRARLLVFADQRNTSTATSGQSSWSAAMFAVDAVRRSGTWKIADLDTFSQ